MREQWECMELCLGRGDASAEKQWISGQSHMGYTVVSICCRQSGGFGKKQMRHLQMFTGPTPHGDLKPPDLCQRGNTAGNKLSGRFLKSNHDNFTDIETWGWESQSPSGVESGKILKNQQERIIEAQQQLKEG